MTILDTAGTFDKTPMAEPRSVKELWVVFGVLQVPDVGHLVLDRWVEAQSREDAAVAALIQFMAEGHEPPEDIWAYRAQEWVELHEAARATGAAL